MVPAICFVTIRIFDGFFRVTSLEQLSLAGLSSEYAKPNVYKNDHRNVLGVWFDSVTKVKICKNQSF